MSSTPDSHGSQFRLLGLRRFAPFFWTQFLGAFNDNLFKQLMLLLAVPVGAAAVSEDDQQWLDTLAASSLAEQEKIERDDLGSFDDYLARYLAQVPHLADEFQR